MTVEVDAAFSASVDTFAAQVRRRREYEQGLAQNVQYVSNIPLGQITSSGVPLDMPNLMGPRTGQCWEIRRITAATFTGGTVSFYRDSVADTNLVYEFTSAGIALLGGGQLILLPGERLVAQAASLTGNATISIGVVQVAQPWLPAYLL